MIKSITRLHRNGVGGYRCGFGTSGHIVVGFRGKGGGMKSYDELKNEEVFMSMLAQLDPELYLIKQALMTTSVNASVIPRIIRQLGNMGMGTGFGDVVVQIRNRKVVFVVGTETDMVDIGIFEDLTPT